MWDLNSWLWQYIKSIIIFPHRIWGGFLPTTRSLNLRNSELNYVPRPRTVSAKGSLHYRGSVLWNKIPSENRKLPNLNVFKPSFHGKDFSNTPQGYRMVPFNLTALAKFWLCSNCSQKLDECSLARARKIFASARMSEFCYNSLPCTVSIICILKRKPDTGNNVSRMENWETSGKRARAMNVSGKMLPRFVNFYWNWPAWVQSQVAG